MAQEHHRSTGLLAAAALVTWGAGASVATATEPCGDLGECKALVEINASDGDIGFHFLMDGDDFVSAKLKDPNGDTIFGYKVQGPLKDQTLTETFAESAEPVCRNRLKEDKDDVVLTLKQFLDRWTAGVYVFRGKDEDGEGSRGKSKLTFNLPAAPKDVDFDGTVITWGSGVDLGECATRKELRKLVADGDLPKHPKDVRVNAWEIVLEPDVDDGDPTGALVYTVRAAGNISPKEVTVPADYLASLPDDTPVKVEVGAIGGQDNATFTEEDGFCVNEDKGCPKN